MLHAGDLDTRITLQQPSVTSDAAGGPVRAWVDVTGLWSKRSGAKGREFWAGQVELASVDEVFTVRWGSAWSGVSASWRVLLDGQPYNIVAALPVGRRESINLICTHIFNPGVPNG